MDSVDRRSNGYCIEGSIAQVLLPSEPQHSNRYNVFGNPEVLPRVGNEYQAEIPNLISGPEFIRLKLDPFDDPNMGDGPHVFHIGLPIPVMWIPQGRDNVKHEQPGSVARTFDSSVEGPDNVKREQHESAARACDSSIKTDSLKLENEIKLDKSGESVFREEVEMQMCKRSTREGCSAVPGALYNLWNELEEANFLLGLYIFGKNLIQVKKFIENKSMGETMSFYYGKFYGSGQYRRWSACRKMKSRRCIYGQKIFTGSRQQELLSRLVSQVSEESQSKLLEASRTFGEGKTSLEEYVFNLKAIVGLRALVEAVGIGKGKQDLTGIGNDPAKSSIQSAPICPEIPIGKACSALSTDEIVTFLTGNYRLSKARSNDLFWEAVWPRLLARGWHSEQPENGISTGSRHSLVFLVPGVKRFSKGKLMKGDHYFDSVSDVLNKVATHPGLLDLDAGADPCGGSTGKEGGEVQWDNEARSDREDSPNEGRHCYLKPRTPTPTLSDGIKFTIVDTSMAVDGIPSKMRELRSLPPEISLSSFRVHFEEDNGDVGSNWGDDSSNLIMEKANTPKFGKVDNGEGRVSSQREGLENYCLSLKNHRKKVSESQPRQKIKTKSKKRQKLDASDCALRSCSGSEVPVATRFEQKAASCCSSDLQKTGDGNTNLLHAGPSPETLSSTNSPSKDVTASSGHEPENLQGPWTVIDLNLPFYSDVEFTEQGLMADSRPNVQMKPPLHGSNARRSPSHTDNAEQQSNNGRRQSTRNRPLTKKALEALAFGLFDTKRKRKNREEFPYETVPRHPPQREPSRACPGGESYSAGSAADLIVEDKGSDDRGGESMFSGKLSGFSL